MSPREGDEAMRSAPAKQPHGPRLGLQVLHAQLAAAGSDKAVTQALEALTQQLESNAGMFDAELVSVPMSRAHLSSTRALRLSHIAFPVPHGECPLPESKSHGSDGP